MRSINLNNVADYVSHFKTSKNGTQVYKGIGEMGEQIIASMKPGESEVSFAVVRHLPKTRTVTTNGLTPRVSEHTTQITEVLRKDAEPQHIIKNATTEKGPLEHTNYMTINELTGRAISRDVFPKLPTFNETQRMDMNSFKQI